MLLTTGAADGTVAAANGYTPLHSAAGGGHAGVVSSLLTAPHVEPNAVDNDKKTALDRYDRCLLLLLQRKPGWPTAGGMLQIV